MRRIPDRNSLAAMLPAGGVGAELGVLVGDYSAQLLAHAKPERLHLVDTWQTTLNPASGPRALTRVRERFAAEIGSGRVCVHQQDTVQWLAAHTASSLDWLYLDSDHSDHHVNLELCQALRVVRRGGYIGGHDYSSVCPGVVSAVNRFCRQHGQTIAVVTDEPPHPVLHREPWMPETVAFNSFLIEVEK